MFLKWFNTILIVLSLTATQGFDKPYYLAPQGMNLILDQSDIDLQPVLEQIGLLMKEIASSQKLTANDRNLLRHLQQTLFKEKGKRFALRFYSWKIEKGRISIGAEFQDKKGPQTKILYFDIASGRYLGESASDENTKRALVRLQEIENMDQFIKADLAKEGTGDLPTWLHTTDPQGGYERQRDLTIEAFRPYIERLRTESDENDEATLRRILSDPNLLPQIDFVKVFGGDIPDRGTGPMRTFLWIKMMSDAGIGKHIMGNHDIWASLNVQGVHLPYYEGFRGIPENYEGKAPARDVAFPEKIFIQEDSDINELLANLHRSNNPNYKSKEWWAEQVAQFMARATNIQLTKWEAVNKQVVSHFETYYGISRKDVEKPGIMASEAEAAWWALILGRKFNEIDVYTGFRAASEMSIQWWIDRRNEMDLVFTDTKYQSGKGWELIDWMKSEINAVIQTEVEYLTSLSNESYERGVVHSIIDATNYRNYESVEWWAKDWLYHGGRKAKDIVSGRAWGPSMVFELVKLQLLKAEQKLFQQRPSTEDLSDTYRDQLQRVVNRKQFLNFGQRSAFSGPVVVVNAFEGDQLDNSFVKKAIAESEPGSVIVVNANGMTHQSLVGGNVASDAAAKNINLIVLGAIRDGDSEINQLDMGVLALDTVSEPTIKQNLGSMNQAFTAEGIRWKSGQYVYVNETDIVVSELPLDYPLEVDSFRKPWVMAGFNQVVLNKINDDDAPEWMNMIRRSAVNAYNAFLASHMIGLQIRTFNQVPQEWFKNWLQSLEPNHILMNGWKKEIQKKAVVAYQKEKAIEGELKFSDLPKSWFTDWMDQTFYHFYEHYQDVLGQDLPGPHNLFSFDEFNSFNYFYRTNFNIFHQDEYGNTYMHALPPIENEGTEEHPKYVAKFTYKGVVYQGETLLEGLRFIESAIKNLETPLGELQEELELVNSWYADATTKLKPIHLKKYVDYGIDKILDPIGITRLFVGHNPTDKLAKVGIGHHIDYRIFFGDDGMSSHYKGRGVLHSSNNQGMLIAGYNSTADGFAFAGEGYQSWDEANPSQKRDPDIIDRKTFLNKVLLDLAQEKQRIMNRFFKDQEADQNQPVQLAA